MNLSPAFPKGIAEHLPNAQFTFDRFHLMELTNEAVDAVRKNEALSQPDLKRATGFGSRTRASSPPSKAPGSRSPHEPEPQDGPPWPTCSARPSKKSSPSRSVTLLKSWMENAKGSAFPPMVKVAYTLMNHWDGVLSCFEGQITNGILEDFNSLIQSSPKPISTARTRTLSTWPT